MYKHEMIVRIRRHLQVLIDGACTTVSVANPYSRPAMPPRTLGTASWGLVTMPLMDFSPSVTNTTRFYIGGIGSNVTSRPARAEPPRRQLSSWP